MLGAVPHPGLPVLNVRHHLAVTTLGNMLRRTLEIGSLSRLHPCGWHGAEQEVTASRLLPDLRPPGETTVRPMSERLSW